MFEEKIIKEILINLYRHVQSGDAPMSYSDLRRKTGYTNERYNSPYDECIKLLIRREHIVELRRSGVLHYRLTDEGRREAESFIRKNKSRIDVENVSQKRYRRGFGILVLAIVIFVLFIIGREYRGMDHIKDIIYQNTVFNNGIDNGDMVRVEKEILFIRRDKGMPAYNTYTCPVARYTQLCVVRYSERINGENWFYVREIGGYCEGWIPQRENGIENVVYYSKCTSSRSTLTR
jgi:hypothetical protein